MAKIPVVRDEIRKDAFAGSRFTGHVSLGMAAAGFALLVGSSLDLGILWLAQRESVPQWEFVAIANSLEAFPRFAIALSLLYASLYFRGSDSLAAFRALGFGLVLLGILGGVLGTLMVLDYLTLQGQVAAEGLAAFRSTALKALVLSALYVLLFCPLGLLGLRRPDG